MAQKDTRRQDIEDAAATLARLLVGIFWERLNNPVVCAQGMQAAAPMLSTEPQTVNRKQAAAMLGVSVNTLDGLVAKRLILPLGDVGRAKRYPVDQIHAYLKKKRE
jgi:membrane-bound lytic murein transglycosylase B